MKKKFLLIGLILIITGFFVYRFLVKSHKKSKASSEIVTLSFSQPTTNQDGSFSTTVKVQPSIDMTIRGYYFKINFDKNKVSVKEINYKIGTVSLGLGDSNSTLSQVNEKGAIDIQGEIQAPEGYILRSSSPTEVVTVAFSPKTNATNLATTSGIKIFAQSVEFYKIGTDFLLSKIQANTDVGLGENGGTITPSTGPLTPTSQPTSQPTEQPTQIPTQTSPPPTTTVSLTLKLKFQGITKRPQNDAPMQVKVKLANLNLRLRTDYQVGTFNVDNDGVWTGTVSFSNVPAGGGYTVYVKGPMHLQKKICDNNPNETFPATYHCDDGKITLNAGANTLDFSKILLLAGDLPEQDGVVNSYDTSLVRNNLGKTDAEAKRLADINRDNIVNTQDHSLIIAALSIRTDEGENEGTEVRTPQPTAAPTNPPNQPTAAAPTATPIPTITGVGSNGDLIRDGSTYPVYVTIDFFRCNGVTSPVSSIVLSLLGKSTSHSNISLTYNKTRPLLVGENININDLLARDIHRGDSIDNHTFGPNANIIVEATGAPRYERNLNNANFTGIQWCTSNEGCMGAPNELRNKRFIHIRELYVCYE